MDCLVKRTLLALMFLRGERNGDFRSSKAMLPYFFAVGHHKYARYLNWWSGREEKNRRKEEGEGRRRLDEANRRKVAAG